MDKNNMTIDIIGGGIAGLATAIALKQQGFAVRVFEQASAFKTVGAGIILASNAMQIFCKLGLRKDIQAKGMPILQVCLTNKQLAVRQHTDLSSFKQQYGVANMALHRADLQAILVNQLKNTELHLGYELQHISRIADGYQLQFTNDNQLNAKMVIGADGIHSGIRKQLFPSTILRSAEQTCWRGVAEYSLPESLQGRLTEAWGEATRFGIVPIGKKSVYWYAPKSNHIEDIDLEVLFSGYASIIGELIRATKHIHSTSIYDFKPLNTWVNGRVALLGDAAHAMTPNLGQGACQGIEDAYVLAECLARYSPENALREYQRLRRFKATKIVNTSWQFGKFAHQTNPALVAIRNAMLRLSPDFVQKRMLSNTFKIEVFS